jgi:hypothetical protein
VRDYIFFWTPKVDVIESQYSILCEKIGATHDFEAIRLAHDHFLASLLAHSFLLMKPVCILHLTTWHYNLLVIVGSPLSLGDFNSLHCLLPTHASIQ